MTLLRGKVVVVGDSQVGKSALTQSFHSNIYPKNYVMTLGVDFCVKTVSIPGLSNSIELFIFDSSGDEMYSDLTAHSWSKCNKIIAVFDATSKASFENAKQWIERVRSVIGKPKLAGALVASKCDLRDYFEVSAKEATEYAASIGFSYFECSALEGSNVENPFLFIASQINEAYERAMIDLTIDV